MFRPYFDSVICLSAVFSFQQISFSHLSFRPYVFRSYVRSAICLSVNCPTTCPDKVSLPCDIGIVVVDNGTRLIEKTHVSCFLLRTLTLNSPHDLKKRLSCLILLNTNSAWGYYLNCSSVNSKIIIKQVQTSIINEKMCATYILIILLNIKLN